MLTLKIFIYCDVHGRWFIFPIITDLNIVYIVYLAPDPNHLNVGAKFIYSGWKFVYFLTCRLMQHIVSYGTINLLNIDKYLDKSRIVGTIGPFLNENQKSNYKILIASLNVSLILLLAQHSKSIYIHSCCYSFSCVSYPTVLFSIPLALCP